MPPAAATASELDAYREQADRFLTELDEEFYLHYAGLKDSFELKPIYDRHAELTRREQAEAIGLAVDGDPGVRELWRFACEGYLGELTREQAERVAGLEAQLEASVDGGKIPYRMLRPTMANEPDRDRRERIEQARNALTEEHLNPIHLDGIEREHRAVTELGAPTYLDLYRGFDFRLDELGEQCRALLDRTEALYERYADRLFRERIGVRLDEARRFDIARLFRAPEWDTAFPSNRMLPALEATLADLGIDLRAQKNVHLDLAERPGKSPRAFCAPIEVPGKVMLVIKPIGGVDDWRALFHEAGHTEHYAHTSPDLPLEARRLGDNAVTEGWAALFEQLTNDSVWSNRRLDMPRPREFEVEAATGFLYFVRRYCAKFLYELEFHAAEDVTALQGRYVELLSDALKLEPSATDYLADIDSGFYASAYLRSWAFETQLRLYLREEFGSAWFARREAGSLLRELWSEGQRHTAEELLREVTGSELELESIGDRLAEVLR